MLLTKAVLPSGVNATLTGPPPTAMSVGFLVLVFTSIVDTALLAWVATKAGLPSRVRGAPAGGDVGGVLGPGLHIDRRHRVAGLVGDEGGLAVRRDRHPVRQRAECDVGGVLGPGLHINRRHRAAALVGDEGGLA